MTPQDRRQGALSQELARRLATSLITLPDPTFANLAVDTLLKLSQRFHPVPRLEARGEHFVFRLPEDELALHRDGRMVCRNRDGTTTEYEDPQDFLRTLIYRDSAVNPSHPAVEIRPYGPFECPIDEVVANRAEVTVKRTKKREFSITAGDVSLTVSNDIEKEITADKGGIIVRNSDDLGDRLALTCSDPHHTDHAPGTVSVVRKEGHNQREGFQVEEIHATGAYLHIEQMSEHDYWMAVGNMSFHFHPDAPDPDDGRERNEVKLTLNPPQAQRQTAVL